MIIMFDNRHGDRDRDRDGQNFKCVKHREWPGPVSEASGGCQRNSVARKESTSTARVLDSGSQTVDSA